MYEELEEDGRACDWNPELDVLLSVYNVKEEDTNAGRKEDVKLGCARIRVQERAVVTLLRRGPCTGSDLMNSCTSASLQGGNGVLRRAEMLDIL